VLKRRIIPTLLLRGDHLVKGERYQSWRRVGAVRDAVRRFEFRGVDELILLDIAATPEGRGPDLAAVQAAADECFMPVAAGGGVRTLEDVRDLLLAGADKVVLGTSAIEDTGFITRAADKFGSQCVTVSVDALGRRCATRCGVGTVSTSPRKHARRAVAAGAGEILLSSVDRDGTLAGYDLDLIRAVAPAVPVPVIASGGAGTAADLLAAFEAGADAVAVGAAWQFTDLTPRGAKAYLREHGVPVR
jgi:cyclase